MARSKGTQVTAKMPLEEIKAMPGKYYFVVYEGVDAGGWCLPAPRPRFAGDIVQEIVITPFDPLEVLEEQLNNPPFVSLYDKVPGIRVYKTDTIMSRPDLTLPKDLADRLTQVQQAQAQIAAMSPYDDKLQMLIDTQDQESSEEEVIRSNRRVVLPFLKAVEFYESRLMNRPEVIKALRKRMEKIINEKSRIETMESF
jgi:hypothetical protein